MQGLLKTQPTQLINRNGRKKSRQTTAGIQTPGKPPVLPKPRKRLRFETSASRAQELPFSDESVSAQFCNPGEHAFSEFKSSLRDKWKQLFSTVKKQEVQGAKKNV